MQIDDKQAAYASRSKSSKAMHCCRFTIVSWMANHKIHLLVLRCCLDQNRHMQYLPAVLIPSSDRSSFWSQIASVLFLSLRSCPWQPLPCKCSVCRRFRHPRSHQSDPGREILLTGRGWRIILGTSSLYFW